MNKTLKNILTITLPTLAGFVIGAGLVAMNESQRKEVLSQSTGRYADLNGDGHPDFFLVHEGEPREIFLYDTNLNDYVSLDKIRMQMSPSIPMVERIKIIQDIYINARKSLAERPVRER